MSQVPEPSSYFVRRTPGFEMPGEIGELSLVTVSFAATTVVKGPARPPHHEEDVEGAGADGDGVEHLDCQGVVVPRGGTSLSER